MPAPFAFRVTRCPPPQGDAAFCTEIGFHRPVWTLDRGVTPGRVNFRLSTSSSARGRLYKQQLPNQISARFRDRSSSSQLLSEHIHRFIPRCLN